MKCKRTGALDFTDLNLGQKLYVLKGSTIQFQVVAKGTVQVVNFTAAAWSGNGLGQGAQCSVTFATNSASNNDAGSKTVTVTFGATAISVSCIVYELTATVTPLDDCGGGHSLADCGIDERLDLGFTTTPAMVSAADVGGLRWSIASPTVQSRASSGLLQKSKTDKGPAAADGRAYFIAPHLTDDVNKPPTAATKVVQLRLSVADGACKGASIDKSLTVHMPIAHMTAQAGSDKHQQGHPSAGFYGLIHLFPRNVSFATLLWREGGGRSVTTGVFDIWKNLAHQTTNKDPGTGKTLTEMIVKKGNSATGCEVAQIDDVFSGSLNYVPPLGASNATVVGTFEWPIYWQYVPADAKDIGWVTFQVAKHIATAYQNGRMVTTKGHTPPCAECTARADKAMAAGNERFP